MKARFLTYLAGASLIAVALFAMPRPMQGQALAAADQDRVVLAIAAQHKIILDNQTKIEDKLTSIEETLRQARIMVSRGGGSR